jgi:uncharacterized protein YecT (DUF1311 family)
MTQKVFISHSSKDNKVATAVCAALESRGHVCWMSSRDIRPGENFQGSIVRAIRDAGVMVLVFSSNANNSDEIKKEMALASQSHKMVIPVRAEDVTPSEDFTYELATRQWIDMFIDWEAAIEKLSRQVDTVIPRTEDSPMAAMRRPAPAGKSRLPLLAGIAAVLLGGGAAGFWLTRPPVPALYAPPPSPGIKQQQATPPGIKPPPAAAPLPDAAKLETELWDSVKASTNAAAVRSYLAKYPAGAFAAAAQARLAALNKPARIVRVQPSFSCEAAANQAERVICADPGLSALDAQTSSLYKKARADAADPAPLADEQTAWLYRRNQCVSAECLRESYAERRSEIGRWLVSGVP